MKKIQSQKGFTLIELLVVVSIIGLMSVLALASLSDTRAKARNANRLTLVRQYVNALELYRTDHGGYYPIPSISGSTYCLGNNNISGNCYGPSYAQDPTLINLLNPYFQGPPSSNDSVIFSGVNMRGLTYKCILDSNSNCPKYLIKWYMEARENKCSGGSVTGNQSSDGKFIECQFISGGVNI